MVIACSKKKIGFNGETPGTNISQASLGCKPHSPEHKSPSHQPIRLYLHTPHILDHSLRSLFETALITHYLNFMLIDFLSAA
jgi:hypothetical protein